MALSRLSNPSKSDEQFRPCPVSLHQALLRMTIYLVVSVMRLLLHQYRTSAFEVMSANNSLSLQAFHYPRGAVVPDFKLTLNEADVRYSAGYNSLGAFLVKLINALSANTKLTSAAYDVFHHFPPERRLAANSSASFVVPFQRPLRLSIHFSMPCALISAIAASISGSV